jgi:molybdate transport system regulatory protein
MYFNYKLWLVNDKNKKIFGLGPMMLILKTHKLGSLNKAAMDMDMSYSKALALIKTAEEELGFKILIRQAGGKDGGGSIITEEAKELIRKYEEFNRRASEAIKEIYNEIF